MIRALVTTVMHVVGINDHMHVYTKTTVGKTDPKTVVHAYHICMASAYFSHLEYLRGRGFDFGRFVLHLRGGIGGIGRADPRVVVVSVGGVRAGHRKVDVLHRVEAKVGSTRIL